MKKLVEVPVEVPKIGVLALKSWPLIFKKIPEGPKMDRKSLNNFSAFWPRDESYGWYQILKTKRILYQK